MHERRGGGEGGGGAHALDGGEGQRRDGVGGGRRGAPAEERAGEVRAGRGRVHGADARRRRRRGVEGRRRRELHLRGVRRDLEWREVSVAERLSADERVRTEGGVCVVRYERACRGRTGFTGRMAVRAWRGRRWRLCTSTTYTWHGGLRCMRRRCGRLRLWLV